jgi:hypothetical protein
MIPRSRSFSSYLSENKDFLCWVILDIYKEYYAKVKNYEKKPFDISKLFKDEEDRIDRRIYAVELNEFVYAQALHDGTSIKMMDRLLIDYVEAWLKKHEHNSSKIDVYKLYKSIIFICGFYTKVNPTLDYDIITAIRGFDQEIIRLESLKAVRMKSLEIPEAFHPFYCEVYSSIGEDNRGTLINYTMRQDEFNFNDQTKSLMFYYMLFLEFAKMCKIINVDFQDFSWLVYEVMKLLGLLERNDNLANHWTFFIFRNMGSRLFCFGGGDFILMDEYLLSTWRAYYNASEKTKTK